jgi:hypothetical protein
VQGGEDAGMRYGSEKRKEEAFFGPCRGGSIGASTNGKSGDFGSPMWRFESSRPSQLDFFG